MLSLSTAAKTQGYEVEWTNSISSTTANIEAVEAIPHGDGGVIVVSNVRADDANTHVRVVRYGPTGNVIINVDIPAGAGIRDNARSAVLNGQELVIGGTTTTQGTSPGEDIFLTRMRVDTGSVTYRNTYDIVAGQRQRLTDMISLGTEVIFTGTSRSGAANFNTVVASVTRTSGAVVWSRVKDVADGNLEFPTNITSLGSDVYVGITSFADPTRAGAAVLSYTGTGTERWTFHTSEAFDTRAAKVLPLETHNKILLLEERANNVTATRELNTDGTQANVRTVNQANDAADAIEDRYVLAGFSALPDQGPLRFDQFETDAGTNSPQFLSRHQLPGALFKEVVYSSEALANGTPLRNIHSLLIDASRSSISAFLFGGNGHSLRLVETGIATAGAPLAVRGSGLFAAVTVQGDFLKFVSVKKIRQRAFASPDTLMTREAEVGGGSLIANDSGLDGATVRIVQPGSGSLTLRSNGTYSYTRSTVGLDRWVYEISGPAGTSQSTLDVAVQPGLLNLVVEPHPVTGGNPAVARIFFREAVVADMAVFFSHGPDPVIRAGASFVDTLLETSPVAQDTTILVRSDFGASRATLNVTVLAPRVKTVNIFQEVVFGGQPISGLLQLTGRAPTGGVTIEMTSNSAAAALPSSVRIGGGQLSSSLAGTTSVVAADTPVTFTARLNGSEVTDTVLVRTGTLAALTVNPSELVGGTEATGTVTLSGPPSSNRFINLSSNSSAITVPTSVTVPSGSATQDFLIRTSAVNADAVRLVTASANGVVRTASMKLRPRFAITNLALNPATVRGGGNSTGTVTLNQVALPGGSTVTLSDNSGSINTPPDVAVLQGNTSATFTVSTTPVTASAIRQITATIGTSTRTVSLTLTP